MEWCTCGVVLIWCQPFARSSNIYNKQLHQLEVSLAPIPGFHVPVGTCHTKNYAKSHQTTCIYTQLLLVNTPGMSRKRILGKMQLTRNGTGGWRAALHFFVLEHRPNIIYSGSSIKRRNRYKRWAELAVEDIGEGRPGVHPALQLKPLNWSLWIRCLARKVIALPPNSSARPQGVVLSLVIKSMSGMSNCLGACGWSGWNNRC